MTEKFIIVSNLHKNTEGQLENSPQRDWCEPLLLSLPGTHII
jgi:hypothetical protein